MYTKKFVSHIAATTTIIKKMIPFNRRKSMYYFEQTKYKKFITPCPTRYNEK